MFLIPARGSDCVQGVPWPAGGHLPVCGDHPDPHPLQRHHLAGVPHLLLLCQAWDHPHQILPPGLHELQVKRQSLENINLLLVRPA